MRTYFVLLCTTAALAIIAPTSQAETFDPAAAARAPDAWSHVEPPLPLRYELWPERTRGFSFGGERSEHLAHSRRDTWLDYNFNDRFGLGVGQMTQKDFSERGPRGHMNTFGLRVVIRTPAP